LNLPNSLTLFRIALVPVFLSIILQSPEENSQARLHAFFIFGIAAFTDALDGFLARKFNQQTELGAFLDPLADKMLVLSGFLGILLTTQAVYKLPIWVQVTVLFRELVIVLGFLTLQLFSKKITFIPNHLGKLTTFSQMALILFCIFNWPGSIEAAYLVAALTIASGIVYTSRELRKFT